MRDVQIAQANATTGAAGAGLISSFVSTISVKTDVADGPSYDVNNHLTWRGTTEVVVDVAWKNASAIPWNSLSFALSIKVRCEIPGRSLLGCA